MNLTISHNSQIGLLSLPLIMDIDDIIRQNIHRLMKLHKLNQRQFALRCGIEPVLLNQILKGIKGMGKDIQSRICSVLKIEPVEFYITDSTPVPVTPLQLKLFNLARKAETIHAEKVVEELAEYAGHRLDVIKKQEISAATESKLSRHKAGSR